MRGHPVRAVETFYRDNFRESPERHLRARGAKTLYVRFRGMGEYSTGRRTDPSVVMAYEGIWSENYIRAMLATHPAW